MQRKRPKCPEQLAFCKIQHNNFEYRAGSYVTLQSPNGFAGRCFPALGCESSIKPLTSTTFDPAILLPKSSNPKEFRAFLTLSSNRRYVGWQLPTGIRMPPSLVKGNTGQHSRRHAPTASLLMSGCPQNRLMAQGEPGVLASVWQPPHGRAYHRCIRG